MKTIALALAATTLASAPATAGVYLNAEANDGYTGSDYSGRTVDVHVGYEGSSEKLDYYIQGGPAFVAVDGVDGTETELSGKLGALSMYLKALVSMVKYLPSLMVMRIATMVQSLVLSSASSEKV